MIKIIDNNQSKDLKARYITDAHEDSKPVGRVYQGDDLIWESDDWYGIKWCEATNTVVRIGNMELHKTLPLQSKMRRCTLNDDGTVYKYISDTDPLKYEDGTTANYDGSDGQVKVEIPDYHHECYNVIEDGNLWNYIKLWPDHRLGITSPKYYIGAFELIQDNADNNLAKGCSVSVLDLEEMGITKDTTSINAADVKYLADASTYRNYNYANVDPTSVKCSYGRPTTNRNREAFRNITKRRGTNWSQQSWDAYNSLLRLYFVEYANFDSQATFNPNLTVEGYHQGGLGPGVTNISSTNWNNFNGYNSFVPCGITIALGNKTGSIAYNFAAGEFSSGAVNINVPSYRGVENPFGHIWKFIDGFNRQGGADNTEKIYICHDVTEFAENAATGYDLISQTTGRASGNIGGIVLDKQGTFWPKPGGSAIYSDYFYNSYSNGTWYTLHAGGVASNGSYAGILCFGADYGAGDANAHIGSRLLYTPASE